MILGKLRELSESRAGLESAKEALRKAKVLLRATEAEVLGMLKEEDALKELEELAAQKKQAKSEVAAPNTCYMQGIQAAIAEGVVEERWVELRAQSAGWVYATGVVQREICEEIMGIRGKDSA